MPTLDGTSGNDTLTGGVGDDTISDTLGGDDSLSGGGGNDLLTVHRLGPGSTVIIDGGDGADQINDVLVSGTVHGGAGADRIWGIETFGGAIYGDDGDDWFFVTRESGVPNQALLIDGGAGNDDITYSGSGPGLATVNGGVGDDRITVGGSTLDGPNQITVDAGDGADTVIVRDSGDLSVRLGTGADALGLSATGNAIGLGLLRVTVLDFNPAEDQIFDLTGSARFAQFSGEAVLQVEDPKAPGHWETVITLASVPVSALSIQNLGGWNATNPLVASLANPWLVGTDGDDSLVLSGSFARLDGGLGNDVLNTALDTNDTLTGGPGADTIQGGGGDDQLAGGSGDDSVNGAGGADTIVETSGSNYLRGGDGNDSIVGGSGFDDINGNKGDDTISDSSGGDDWLVGGQGNDLISATVGGNILYGNLGNDTLHGGSGAEIVRGGQGDDSITGGGGNDFISGDRGADTESGGSGADIFHTFSGAGVDRVLDFNLAEGDRVQVDPGTTWTVTQVGADTVIDMGNGDQMILVGVQSSTLTGTWIFAA